MRWFWGPLSPLGLGLAVLTLAVDQAHKWWMLHVYRIGARLAELNSIPLVDGTQPLKRGVYVTPFLDLLYVKNYGISYGLFPLPFPPESLEAQRLLAGFAVLAAVAMAIWLARGVADRLVAVSLGFIMGGALSNAIDRLVLGGVADFFLLHVAHRLEWYVFNIADAAIVAGVCGLLYDSVSPSRNRASKSP